MKSTLIFAFLASFILFASFTVSAQFKADNIKLTAYGTVTVPNYAYPPVNVGGGIGAKYFFKPNVAYGLNVKYMPVSYSFKQSKTSRVTNKETYIPVTATFEVYLLKKRPFHPYVGAEGGVYFRSTTAEIEGSGTYHTSAIKFGVAPRAGFMYNLKNVNIFAEASYQFILGTTTNAADDKTVVFKWKAPNQVWAFNAGVMFNLFNKQKQAASISE
ncbi:MAG: OmpW family outer membrane protein [Siphonobacter sp.]